MFCVHLFLLFYDFSAITLSEFAGFHTKATASATVKAVATVAISTAPAKALATKVHP